MTIILGAGLTGLSTAYHLELMKQEYHIFEKESRIGGLCRTVEENGYKFDYTGHLLHMRNDYVKFLIDDILPNKFKIHKKRASIYCQKKLIGYPFQANFHGLPKSVVKECLLYFIETLTTPKIVKAEDTFEEWALNTFGSGIVKYFMKPYNEKLYRCALRELSSDWVSWSIPRPNLEEVINGLLGFKNREFGYNPIFLYPKKGGINILPETISQRLKNITVNKEASVISMNEKKILFNNDSYVNFSRLVSTIPLPQLLKIITDLPSEIRDMADKLKYVSVLNINLGIRKQNISNKHWIYFPESEFLFYRVGFYNNFSTTISPSHNSSCYIEISYRPEEGISQKNAIKKSLKMLKSIDVVNNEDEVEVINILNLPYAYVLHDEYRKAYLAKIHEYLNKRDISSIGRFGAWKYSTMEDAILEGKETAEYIAKSNSSKP